MVGSNKTITHVETEMTERLGDAEKRYYERVVDILKERDGDEETDTFTENVLQQIQSDGVVRVFCDKEGSRAVERLLQACKCDNACLRSLLEPIVTNFHSVAQDRCGSHPTEALIKEVGRHIFNQGSGDGGDDGDGDTTSTNETLEILFLKIFEGIKPNLGDMLTHPYASHVMCTAVQVLSGVYVAEYLTRSRYSREFRKAKLEDEQAQKGDIIERSSTVPETFTKLLSKLGRWIYKLDNFSQLLVDTRASPVVQVMLRVLMERLPKQGGKMIQQVIETVKLSLAESDNEDDNSLPQVFTCAVGSHLIGVLLELAAAELHQWIWETCFKGRVFNFSLHPVGNYPLQQFMTVADSGQVGMVIAELLPHIEDVLFVGHSGVVVKLVEAGLKSIDHQSDIMKALLIAFHCENDTKCCVPSFLTLTAYEVYTEHKENMKSDKDLTRKSVHVQGSLLVQALLKNENPRVIVRSMLNMETDDVMWLSCDVAGSHAIDAFLTSVKVKPVKRRKLVDKLRPQLVALCKDKHGSRVIDAVWRSSDIAVKESLAEEMIANEDELADNFYGRIVMRNCNIVHYRRKQTVSCWQDKTTTAATKTQRLFNDILKEDKSSAVGQDGRKRKLRNCDSQRVDIDHKTQLPEKKRKKASR